MRDRLFLYFLSIIFLASGCSTQQFKDHGLERKSIISGEIQREFLVFAPEDSKGEKLPLVIALHGAQSNSELMAGALNYRFIELAKRDRVILIFPDGIGKTWNDGRGNQNYEATAKNIDDLKFLDELIDKAQNLYSVDPNKIFMLGSSNGGFMTFYYACTHTEKLKAIGSIISGMSSELIKTCNPGNSTSLTMINGKADPLVKFNGGEIKIGRKTHGEVMPAVDTLKFWGLKANCLSSPKIKTISKGTEKLDEITYSGCSNLNTIKLYAIDGAGHGIPGSKQYLPQFIIGKMSAEFNGPDIIWENFSKDF
jgi:polyhydroxybutyrate depolymerase